jgi:bifunctional DNA-binding transcriptional regulator/antitoxin component of YhaV-PrlF toxin-antitoxin module
MLPDCEEEAKVRIDRGDNGNYILCQSHVKEFKKELKQDIAEKFEGMDEDAIRRKLIEQGESLL